MEQTKIQWCDFTFNPWIGCSKVHAGCQNCYAEDQQARRYQHVIWGAAERARARLMLRGVCQSNGIAKHKIIILWNA